MGKTYRKDQKKIKSPKFSKRVKKLNFNNKNIEELDYDDSEDFYGKRIRSKKRPTGQE